MSKSASVVSRVLVFAVLLIIVGSCSKSKVQSGAPEAVYAPSIAMPTVDICRDGTCRKFSRLVMGTDHLLQGGWTSDSQPKVSEEEAFKVLDEAAKHGINFFDTSPIYVEGVENKLGIWKKSRAQAIRDDAFYYSPALKPNPDRSLYVLSKGGFPFDLFDAKHLASGSHSLELGLELAGQGILPPGTQRSPKDGSFPLTEVPPGTYASRLYGNEEQISERVSGELVHTLKNLDGDITVYLMHRDDGDAVGFKTIPRDQTPVNTIMQALSVNEVASKFWILGWSNWKTDRVNQSIELASAQPELLKPAINSPYFSLLEMSETTIHALGVQVTHAEMMDPEFQKGIKIMPYSPLGGFSILDKPEPKWENAKEAARLKQEAKDPYWQNVHASIFTPANEARWHRLVEFTESFNRTHQTAYTLDQMMNAYVLAHPRTDLLAIGALTVEQVRRTVASLELAKKLTAADLEYLYSGAK